MFSKVYRKTGFAVLEKLELEIILTYFNFLLFRPIWQILASSTSKVKGQLANLVQKKLLTNKYKMWNYKILSFQACKE